MELPFNPLGLTDVPVHQNHVSNLRFKMTLLQDAASLSLGVCVSAAFKLYTSFLIVLKSQVKPDLWWIMSAKLFHEYCHHVWSAFGAGRDDKKWAILRESARKQEVLATKKKHTSSWHPIAYWWKNTLPKPIETHGILLLRKWGKLSDSDSAHDSDICDI